MTKTSQLIMSKASKKSTTLFKEKRVQRIFSETFKRSKVKELEQGLLTVRELSKLYSVSVSAVYKWIYKYSVHYKKGTVQVVQMESEQSKTQELLVRIKDLEAALGRKQLSIEYLEHVLCLASSELKIDLKKSFDIKSSHATTKTIKAEDIK